MGLEDSGRTKESPQRAELMSLAIAIVVHCEGCIACHVHDALDHGASREEVAETVGVAVMMGGGPSVVYGSLALEALEQFLAQDGPKP
ncbi:carboxymuconolactone decarboxylase family protein [Limnochorda pilosa]|uniref:Alkylhydroperoxidase n=1 Tax=Limnochorda pilosa TaxID=1555112 RepID=A0A0K2SKW0_LIMPI|nr:carboxymuconolactone decarboxylase family protein [Limnochorda pilosa]BAS27730.1 alkylhydroperoxidase [Limnochorda pilosa]